MIEGVVMKVSTTSAPDVRPAAKEPWQLRLFRKSLKKQQKLAALLKLIGPLTPAQQCLLVTCGDNNGALNWHFKQHGGRWTWADAEPESSDQIADLTGDEVLAVEKGNPHIPVADDTFDLVVTIDVHEHLESTALLNRELARVVKPGGRVVVTTPGGDPRKLANRIKGWVGMDKSDYGHVVDGYDVPALQSQLRLAELTPVAKSSYSRFFTEMLELGINLAYVKFLSRRSKAKVEQGQIAPQNQDQVKSVEKTIKLYSLIYPGIWLVSQLDRLLPFMEGHAVIVAATKEQA
jgi:SAM-dependent methyltransferase